jgi:erythronate-4-phosphate dehydrogenase
MIVVLDESIPFWDESFGQVGEVRPFASRVVPRRALLDADALIVRTVTRVDASILDESSVRFVGTTSAGTDHLDLDYLQSRKIHVAAAAGSNANAVAEYVVAALLAFSERRSWRLKDKSLAIVGVGHVGSRVNSKARALGMEVILCDPPLREATGESCYRSYREALEADIITFHVPLTFEGRYPTWHMVNQSVLDHLAPGRLLLNTSRGPVFDNSDLKNALRNKKICGAILDVWEKEPVIDYELLDLVDIGTSHIAGSSLDAKIQAIAMVYEGLCRFFGLSATWNGHTSLPGPSPISPEPRQQGEDALRSVVLQACDILQDDAHLRELRTLAASDAAMIFDRLRNRYRLRSEFGRYVVALPQRDLELGQTLASLGFELSAS